jgi:hypothetical protein
MAAVRYHDLIREMRNILNHPFRPVELARQRGIKPTPRLSVTSYRTVRKYSRRYQQRGPSGLEPLPPVLETSTGGIYTLYLYTVQFISILKWILFGSYLSQIFP